MTPNAGSPIFYVLAVATGFDVSTLSLLSWADYEPSHKTLHEVRPKVGKNVFVFGNPAWLFDLLEAGRELGGAPGREASRETLKASPIFAGARIGRGSPEIAARYDRGA